MRCLVLIHVASIASAFISLADQSPDAVASAMGSNQTIRCAFTAEVVSVTQLTGAMPPEALRHGYMIDSYPKWEVTLMVHDQHQNTPFQPGISRCWVADIQDVFARPEDDVRGVYSFSFLWNIRVPGKQEFEDFRATKIRSQNRLPGD